MKAIFCILMSILTILFPIKPMKNFCKKLADSAYVISEPNEDDRKSTAVRVISSKQI